MLTVNSKEASSIVGAFWADDLGDGSTSSCGGEGRFDSSSGLDEAVKEVGLLLNRLEVVSSRA